MGVTRSIAYSVHAVLLFISFLLVCSGLLTPRWQEIQFQQSGDIHHHGMWQDCTYAYREGSLGQWTCTYKDFGHPWYGSRNGRGGDSQLFYADGYGHHDNAWWRVDIICMLVVASLFDMIALTLCFIICCLDRVERFKPMRIVSIITAVLELLSLLLSGSAVIFFTRMAYEPEYRTVVEAGQTVREQQAFGVSYYISIVGAVIGIVSLFVGILATVLTFMAERSNRTYLGGGHKDSYPSMAADPIRRLSLFPPDTTSHKGSLAEREMFLPNNILPGYELKNQDFMSRFDTGSQAARSRTGSLRQPPGYDDEEELFRANVLASSAGLPQQRSRAKSLFPMPYDGSAQTKMRSASVISEGVDYYHNTPV